jgi:hypothetical protein
VCGALLAIVCGALLAIVCGALLAIVRGALFNSMWCIVRSFMSTQGMATLL